MKKKFGLHEPYFVGNEKKYLLSCIKDNWVSTSGKFLRLFEKEICKKTKAKFAVSVSSCTAGLHISCMASGFKRNDEVIVPAQTHTATAHAVEYTGATPVFADVDFNTRNIAQNNQLFTKHFSKIFTLKITLSIINTY